MEEEEVEEEQSEVYEYHGQGCGYQDDTSFKSCPVCADIAAPDEEEEEEEEEEKDEEKRGQED